MYEALTLSRRLQDASFKLVFDLLGLHVAPWYSSCGHPIVVQGFKVMEDSMLSADPDTRSKEKILELANEPEGKARLQRAMMRCCMCLYLAMSFDDAANSHGIIQVMLVDKIEFGAMLKISAIFDEIHPVMTDMVYNLFPVRACRKCIWVGTPWWIRWVLYIFSMFAGQDKQDLVIQTNLPGLWAMLGGRQYVPTCNGIKDYVMRIGQTASASCPRPPLLPPPPTSPLSELAHYSSVSAGHDEEEETMKVLWDSCQHQAASWCERGLQDRDRDSHGGEPRDCHVGEPRGEPRETPSSPPQGPQGAGGRLAHSWRFVNYVQQRMKIAPEELKPTALLRMRQLHALFLVLHHSGVVRLEYGEGENKQRDQVVHILKSTLIVCLFKLIVCFNTETSLGH
jgi:hypothetical protein